MNSHSKQDVFISYNHKDEEISKKIGEYLENKKIGRRNIKVFLAPWDIKPGDNFIDKIDQALTKTKFYALVLSPDALKAEWPTAERAAALLSDPSGRLGRVIPILVKPCTLPPLLATRNRIDLREKSKFEIEMQRMLYTIKEEPLPRNNNNSHSDIKSEYSSLIDDKILYPDKIDEFIHTNLFPVIKRPSIIWIAPTNFYNKTNIYSELGSDIPPFILREKYVCSFSNLKNETNKLRKIIDIDEIKSINVNDWFIHKDKSKWLIDLLSAETKKFTRKLGLYFDKKGKQFYGDKKIITNEKVSWTAHVRKGSRGLIIPYTKKDNESNIETTYFYRHRAVSLKFQIIGNELFLQIDPGWEFSQDGSILIQGKRRSVLNTRLRSRIRNNVEFDEMRFWAWLLSDGKKITMGSEYTIEIDYKPLKFKTPYGIFGDHKPLPDVVEEPPPLIGKDDDDLDIIIKDEDLDKDISEVEYNDV